MLDIKFKKRPTLGEACFRKYERDIADATKGTIVVDPMERKPPMKASSYAVQIRDALKSFATEHWASTLVPPLYEVERIKVRITEDDRVALVNEYEDRMGTKDKDNKPKTSIIVGVDGTIVRGFQKDPVTKEKTTIVKWPEEKDMALGICRRYHTAEKEWPGPATVNLIHCPDEAEQKKVLELEKTFPTLEIENVFNGYYRINRW